MNFADRYLDKQKNFFPAIEQSPENDLGMVVVIPCFDEPDLIKSLESLKNCSPTECYVEIIVVFNLGRNASTTSIQQNVKSRNGFEKWNTSQTPERKFHYIWIEERDNKDAGAGLARKTGMDEAIYRFNTINRPEGILVSFDADTVCDPNYLSEIEKHHRNHPDSDGTTIYFEHPVSGDDYTPGVYHGITQYELYLRYFKTALKYAGFPFAFHTVGSCFTVKAESYVKQGGMNKKQAGEDFYFIHKLAPLGNFHEINSTRVIPSPRLSDRVPFGTGPTIRKIAESAGQPYLTYNLLSFNHLGLFLKKIDQLYNGEDSIPEILSLLPESIQVFLENQDVVNRIAEINRNSASIESFRKRFFRWFNAFLVIKFLNFAHEQFYEKVPVTDAARELLVEMDEKGVPVGARELLERYRKMERGMMVSK